MAIGKRSDIPLEKAHEYVWGYATGLDMTRRDRQMEMRQMGRPWKSAKRSISAPIAPLHKAAETHNVDNALFGYRLTAKTINAAIFVT